MDIRKVKKLIEMLEASEVSEIEIHEGEESVRISRLPSMAEVPSPAATSSGAISQSIRLADKPPLATPMQGEPATAAAAPPTDAPPDGQVVKSPMVGIFYESPTPGRPAFVELGQAVKAGDVLCIIEAMKIMNHIEAEGSGVISKIMVGNGEPVEYGQPLFELRDA